MSSSLQSVNHFSMLSAYFRMHYILRIQDRLLLSAQFTTEAKAGRLALIGVLPSFAGEDHYLHHDLSLHVRAVHTGDSDTGAAQMRASSWHTVLYSDHCHHANHSGYSRIILHGIHAVTQVFSVSCLYLREEMRHGYPRVLA